MEETLSLLQREALRAAISHEMPIDKRLVFTPLLDPKQVGPASVDLRLGTDFFVLRKRRGSGLDPARATYEDAEALQERVTIPLGEPFWLHPQQFALGATLEYMRIPPDMGGYVLSRSSWGRVGLLVATAIMVQPGYTGTLTLELVNEGDTPIALYPGLRVAQLALHRLETETGEPYKSDEAKYSSPTGPQVSRLAWDRDEMKRVKALRAQMETLSGQPPGDSAPE
jgi:dCTP deaminase